jgi:hypothetical protein
MFCVLIEIKWFVCNGERIKGVWGKRYLLYLLTQTLNCDFGSCVERNKMWDCVAVVSGGCLVKILYSGKVREQL